MASERIASARLAHVSVLAGIIISGCTQSVYDYPVPTMVDQVRGYSLTGFVATTDENVVRMRIAKNTQGVCPGGVDFVSFATTRADATIGTKILRYEAIVTCKTPAP